MELFLFIVHEIKFPLNLPFTLIEFLNRPLQVLDYILYKFRNEEKINRPIHK